MSHNCIILLYSLVYTMSTSYAPLETEDFFTKLSFSALICELSDKENFMLENIALPQNTSAIRVDREVERWLNSKSDQELINLIFM